MILADLWKELESQRWREIADLKQQVQELKQQNQAERSSIQEDLKIQAQETRQVLSDFITNLQQQGAEARKQRQEAKKQRQQEVSDRQEKVSESLKKFARNRHNYRIELSTNAKVLSEALQISHQNLQSSVWGIAGSFSGDEKLSTVEQKKTDVKVDDKTKKPETKSELKVTEEVIYQFIEQVDGVSLVELEKELGIKRQSTIPLIRKLIQKGMLEQRDRRYFVCN